MTDKQLDAASVSAGSIYWKRNLAISLLGSFTTIVAMTLLLPFLPLYVEELGVSDHAFYASERRISDHRIGRPTVRS